MKYYGCFEKELNLINELIKQEVSSEKKEILNAIYKIVKNYELIVSHLDVEERKDIGDLNPTYHACFNFDNFISTFQYMDLCEMKRDFRRRKEEYERNKNNE